MLDFSALANLVTQQKTFDRGVFVTLHSTAGLRTLTAETGMLEVRRALKLCDGVFVHSLNDVEVLEAFKVRKNVNFLPNPQAQSQSGESAVGDQVELVADYLLRKMTFAIARGNSG